jgi:hypothetical protein
MKIDPSGRLRPYGQNPIYMKSNDDGGRGPGCDVIRGHRFTLPSFIFYRARTGLPTFRTEFVFQFRFAAQVLPN